MSDLTAATIETPDAFRHGGNGSSHFRSYLHGGGPCLNPAQGCEPVWFTTEPPAACLAAPRDQTEDGLTDDQHCYHCGKPPEADGDHTCPCPFSDTECLEHTLNPAPSGRQWIFGPQEAARFIARTSWPFERADQQAQWAMRLTTEPDMLATEATAARERLEGAISYLRALLADQPDTTASEEDQR